MSGLNRSTVLVVDDHEELRSLLISILRNLGCEKVVAAESGAEAIEILKTVKTRPERIGVYDIDAVNSEWVMPGVDGAELLRWIRQSNDCPDNYMPFLMMSSYSDAARVEESRDLGANGFLAKPFSGHGLATYLLDAMTDDRHYVALDGYFGPDRRRKKEDVPEEFRDAEASYEDKGLKYHPPPKKIREKIGADFEFSDEKLEEADRDIEDWSQQFLDWTKNQIARIVESRKAASEAAYMKRFPILEEIRGQAEELANMGGTFGYPLVAVIGKSLLELTLGRADPSDNCIELIGKHTDTLRAVLRENVRGEGGRIGQQLVKELSRITREYRDNL